MNIYVDGATNTRSSAKQCSSERWEQYQQYDALPTIVRRALQEATLNWECAAVAAVYLAYGQATTLRLLAASEMVEIQKFAEDFWKRDWGDYPFLAAHGTILRYNSRSY